MAPIPNIPLSWLDEFKKSLRRGNQATPDDIQPMDNLADRRLALPEAIPNRVDTAPRTYGPMDTAPVSAPPDTTLPDLSLADRRLANSPTVPTDAGLSPSGAPATAMNRTAAPYPFTPRPEYTDAHKPGEPIGLGQRILHALKGAGLGALRGAANGGAGMLGGAITGGIAAGANPNAYHKLKYNTFTLPQWREKYEDEAAQAKTQQGLEESQSRVANTQSDNDLAERRLAATEAAQKTNEGYRRDTLTETQLQHRTANAQQAKNEHDQRHPGELYPPNVTDQMPWLKGEKAPVAPQRQTQQKAYVKTEMGSDGVEYGLTPDGQWEPTKTTEGAPFKRYHVDPDRERPEKTETPAQSRTRVQAAQRDITKFHDLGNKINYWAEKRGNRARAAEAEMDAGKKANLKNAEAQAEAEQNKAERDWAAARDALKSHGDLVRLNPDGTKAELVQPEAAAKLSRSARGRTTASNGLKIGDLVTVPGGKTVKIGKIHPDGSFDPE